MIQLIQQTHVLLFTPNLLLVVQHYFCWFPRTCVVSSLESHCT